MSPCTWVLKPTGEVACVWSGLTGGFIVAMVLGTVFIIVLAWSAVHHQRIHSVEEARREARYNRFLELLRDVRMRLMN